MMNIAKVERKADGVFLVTVHGPIDFDTYRDVQKVVDPLLSESSKAIIFDMKEVEYISSVGIGLILKAKIFMEGIRGKFIMIGLKPQVQMVFEIIKALPSMQIFENMKEVDDYFMKIQMDEINKNKGGTN